MSASKMTVITGLRYDEVETTVPHGDYGKVRICSFSLDGFNVPPTGTDPIPDSCSYREYYIRGRRVCTPNGKVVYLGNAPVVEEFLGLQFDLFENLKKEKSDALFKLSKAEEEKSDALFKLSKSQQRVEELKVEVSKVHQVFLKERKKLMVIMTMSFLKRLKFLFTGELV